MMGRTKAGFASTMALGLWAMTSATAAEDLPSDEEFFDGISTVLLEQPGSELTACAYGLGVMVENVVASPESEAFLSDPANRQQFQMLVGAQKAYAQAVGKKKDAVGTDLNQISSLMAGKSLYQIEGGEKNAQRLEVCLQDYFAALSAAFPEHFPPAEDGS